MDSENERRFETAEEYYDFINSKIKETQSLDYLDYISKYIELSFNWISPDH